MKALINAIDILKSPTFIKITSFTLLFLSVFYLANHYSDTYPQLTFFTSIPPPPTSSPKTQIDSLSPTPEIHPSSPPPPPPPPPMERMGVVDENGAMSDEFKVGEVDYSLVEDVGNASSKVDGESERKEVRVKVQKFERCDESMRDYIPCLDNVEEIKKLNSTERGEKYERHCPGEGSGLDCLVPAPKGYQSPIPWPKSRDEVWFSNVPHTRLVEDKGGQNWISVNKDKFTFPGGGTQFIHGADQYLDQISQMVPDIAFGRNTRVALDIGCGVASFGAYLLQRNVTTLSISISIFRSRNRRSLSLSLSTTATISLTLFRSDLFDYYTHFTIFDLGFEEMDPTRIDFVLYRPIQRNLIDEFDAVASPRYSIKRSRLSIGSWMKWTLRPLFLLVLLLLLLRGGDVGVDAIDCWLSL